MEEKLDIILQLLAENNRLLKDIKEKLERYESKEYCQFDELRAFSINVAANLLVEAMENSDEINAIKENFKKSR